jgi:hypothetical protein
MPMHRSRLVRVMSEEQIVGITGTLPYATSVGRNWTGVEVHRYRVSGPSPNQLSQKVVGLRSERGIISHAVCLSIFNLS